MTKGQVGGYVPFAPVVTAVLFATADGPLVPVSPFTEHVPGAEYGGTAATMTFTGSGPLAPFSAGGTVGTI